MLAEQISSYLKYISVGKVIIIKPTDGTFRGQINVVFTGHKLDVTSDPTEESELKVFRLIKDGTFGDIFGSFGENLDRLCLTQSQIRQLYSEHLDLLGTDSDPTFFLFKAWDEFSVVRVHRNSDDELNVWEFHFSDDRIWRAEDKYRVVLPAL